MVIQCLRSMMPSDFSPVTALTSNWLRLLSWGSCRKMSINGAFLTPSYVDSYDLARVSPSMVMHRVICMYGIYFFSPQADDPIKSIKKTCYNVVDLNHRMWRGSIPDIRLKPSWIWDFIQSFKSVPSFAKTYTVYIFLWLPCVFSLPFRVLLWQAHTVTLAILRGESSPRRLYTGP